MATSPTQGSGPSPAEQQIQQNTKVIKYIQDILSSPAVGDVGGEALKALAGKQSAIVQENLILKSMVALSTQTPATSGGTPPSTSPTPTSNQTGQQ